MPKKSEREYERMDCAASGGGALFTNKEELEAQQGVAMDVLKQLGSNVIKSKSLINISFPVRIFEPRSYLERLLDGFVTAPHFFGKAAASKDPVERMKLVATAIISGLPNTIKMLKPFNPILGETYQGVFEDGTQIFVEQGSHHPPVSIWEFLGPDGQWSLTGFGEWTASFRLNSVKGCQKGPILLRFHDGQEIVFSLPHVVVKGLLYGTRTFDYEGSIVFTDEKNELCLDVEIGSIGGGWFGKKTPSDYIKGELKKAGAACASISGTWLGCVEWDNEVYWSFKDSSVVSTLQSVEHPLPSDSRFRTDLILLAEKRMDEAQEEKVVLEQNQRADKALRIEGLTERGSIVLDESALIKAADFMGKGAN